MSESGGLKILIKNQSNTERMIRAAIAIVVIAVTYFTDSSLFEPALILGGALIFNAVSGNCYIYRLFGFSTCPLPESE